MLMKSAFAQGGKGIEALEFREAAIPNPGPGEALVRLRAATLNFRDLLFIKGMLPGLAKEPEYVPLSCATGEVIAVGAGVSDLKPGDRVNPQFFQGIEPGARHSPDMLGGSADGVARTHAVFRADSLCLTPDELGDLEAATLPCAGLTAWTAVFGARPIQAGERVLVQGTGGVSLAALQWAKAAGAEVVVTSSSDAKLHRARALGADVTVNYRTTPDWAKAAREQSGGKGVDIVVDVAGTHQLEASASVLNDGGIIAAIGMLDGAFSWGKEIGQTIVPVSVGNREEHQAMTAFAAKHAIRPIVDVVYDLNHLADALRHLESGRFFGKVGVNLL
ncbi:NAD(P)-dependent alcohol dehydrogenase [Phenylobacterium sp. LjRoot225]|uniref:zinc-dependent alcohol dehydrogenase family protein n=1 Tax=Phenylobacterium sp. LjRoot225 TaxID=3342285 RepID=UPI003ED0394E